MFEMAQARSDFLDELISERAKRNPEFPAMVDAASRRRRLLAALADRRRAGERSQTAIAAAMASSQSSIARLETSASDARVSTVERYAEVLGYRVQYHLIPAAEADDLDSVVVHPPAAA
jgi:hypothetical protein